MAVDPRYYVSHAIYFTLGAVLFGFFLFNLRKEVLLHGWSLAPRCVWLSCLCCSSFGFVIIQLDPVGAMGMFSDPWQIFLGITDATLLVGSVCASSYIYLLISLRSDSIPLFLARIWVACNVGAFVIIFVLSLTTAILNDMFWIVIGFYVLAIQEVCIFLGLAFMTYRTTKVLSSVKQVTDYGTQLRKIWTVSICGTILIASAIANQLAGLPKISVAWNLPVPISELDTFQFRLIAADLMTLIAHMLLLLLVRPATAQKSSSPVVRLTDASKDVSPSVKTEGREASRSARDESRGSQQV